MTGEPSAGEPASPCIGLCTIDECSGWCRGCHRSLDEIAAWPVAGLARKRAILADVARRAKDLAGRSITSAP